MIGVYLVFWGLLAFFPVPYLAHFKLDVAGRSVGIFHVLFTAGMLGLLATRWKVFCRSANSTLLVWIPLLMSLAIGVFFSTEPATSIQVGTRFFLQGIIPALFWQYSDDNERSAFFMGTAIIAAGAAIVGIVEAFFGQPGYYRQIYETVYQLAVNTFAGRGYVGVMGTLGHPVPYAVLLAPFIPAALACRLSRLVKAGLIVLIGGALVASQSRAGIGAAFGGTAVYFFFQFWPGASRRTRMMVFGGTAVVALLAYVTLIYVVGGRFKSGFHLDSHRKGAYTAGLHIVRDHKAFGTGLGTYPDVIGTYQTAEMDAMTETPDNQYLRWFIETGLTGFLLLLTFFVLFTVSTVRALWTVPRPGGIANAAFGGFVASFFSMFFIDGYYWVPLQLTFWTFVGVCLSIKPETK